MSSTGDMTVRGAFSGGSGLVIDSPATLWKLAENIAEAGICPAELRGKPADVFLVMSMGLEMGFSATASISMIYVVKGRPSLGYEACLAKIQSHPSCEDCRTWNEGDGDEFAGCIATTRKGRKPNEVIRFTMRDAKQAGLTKGDNWQKYPSDMLIAKAVARSKRRDWPDILPGLQVYEDLRELVEVRNVTPVRDASAPPREDPARALLGGSPAAFDLPAQIAPMKLDVKSAAPVLDDLSGNPVEFGSKTLSDLKDAIESRVQASSREHGKSFQPGPFRAQLRKKLAALYPDLKDGDDRLLDAIADASSMEVSQ